MKSLLIKNRCRKHRVVCLALALFSLLCLTSAKTPAQTKPTGGAAVVKSHSRFARLEGMRVRYLDAGRGDEALVFIHGWTCSADFWRRQTSAFKDARVIALDLPGHGESDKPQIAYTMDLFARAVAVVLQDAGVRRAVLIGHSMGTPVARQFYRLYPDKMLALVIVDGALRPFAPREAMLEFIKPLRGDDYQVRAGSFVDGMLHKETPAELRREIKSAMLATPQHVAISAMEGMSDDAIWKPDQINVPTLAVLARSPFWPPDNESRYRAIAPKLEYHMWDGVSHFLMMEQPEKFNQTLRAFIERNKLIKQYQKG